MPLLLSSAKGLNVAVGSIIMTVASGSIVAIGICGVIVLRAAMLQGILV
jgi:hypothetical protein